MLSIAIHFVSPARLRALHQRKNKDEGICKMKRLICFFFVECQGKREEANEKGKGDSDRQGEREGETKSVKGQNNDEKNLHSFPLVPVFSLSA